MSTPCVLVGDLYGQPTGLSRILTDLATHLSRDSSLDLDVRSVGWVNWPGSLPGHGVELQSLPSGAPRCWAFHTLTDWGKGAVETAYRTWFGDQPGIILTVWDAHRCWALQQADLPVQWWGYVPVDAVNVNGMVGGGPVGECLARYDRLLAYTGFGAEAIRTTLGTAHPPVPHLPHGLNLDVWHPTRVDPTAMATVRGHFARTIRAKAMLLGCVATNQPRKDWGLVAATLAALRADGIAVHGWWHTDQPVSDAWSLPQLAEDFDLEDVLTITTRLTDADLAAAYTCCAATIAPGRGEGMGYPVLESLAMGTPVVHADHGGAAAYVPAPWRLPVQASHAEGPYGLLRPIVAPRAAADVLGPILTGQGQLGSVVHRAHLPQFVEALSWPTLWPQWAAWIREGL
jgi:glycosyltransferase involved in cell wall biosynthesis